MPFEFWKIFHLFLGKDKTWGGKKRIPWAKKKNPQRSSLSLSPQASLSFLFIQNFSSHFRWTIVIVSGHAREITDLTTLGLAPMCSHPCLGQQNIHQGRSQKAII